MRQYSAVVSVVTCVQICSKAIALDQKLFKRNVLLRFLIFLLLFENFCCVHSLEEGVSNEYLQDMLSWRNKKVYTGTALLSRVM